MNKYNFFLIIKLKNQILYLEASCFWIDALNRHLPFTSTWIQLWGGKSFSLWQDRSDGGVVEVDITTTQGRPKSCSLLLGRLGFHPQCLHSSLGWTSFRSSQACPHAISQVPSLSSSLTLYLFDHVFILYYLTRECNVCYNFKIKEGRFVRWARRILSI